MSYAGPLPLAEKRVASSSSEKMRSKPMLDRMKGVKSRFVLIATFSSEQHDYEGCAHPGATPSDCQPTEGVGENQLGQRKTGFKGPLQLFLRVRFDSPCSPAVPCRLDARWAWLARGKG